MNKFIKRYICIFAVIMSFFLSGCSLEDVDDIIATVSEVSDFIDLEKKERISPDKSLLELEFDGENQIVEINDNQATFSQDELSLEEGSWQEFSDLDRLNRVGIANAMLHKSMMPTEEREALYVDPTGWKNKKLNVDGKQKWLYNRSHLIGYQFTGENNNLKNLMTGTSSLNTPCMLEYENMVAKYIKETNNHVRYQVEPVFRDNELVARGVHMQAKSVEDDSLEFNIYIFNVENGVKINYEDGSSKIDR